MNTEGRQDRNIPGNISYPPHGCQESKWPTRGLISFLKIGCERKKPRPLAATLPLLCCGLLWAPERGRMRVPLWLLWMSWRRWMCWWSCAGWPRSVGCWEQTSPHSCPPYPALKHKATEDISDWDSNKTTQTSAAFNCFHTQCSC